MGACPATTPVDPPAASPGRRRTTTTASFGVGRREGHDASAFYARFTPPRLSDDDVIARPAALDTVWVGDARDMDTDGSVALVVTSPPCVAGTQYEHAMGVDRTDLGRLVILTTDTPPACSAGKRALGAATGANLPAHDVCEHLDPVAAVRLADHGSGGEPPR